MMRLTLLSAAAISAVHAITSTTVFPNSLCQGASGSLGGLVGVGKVTRFNGNVEVSCGCLPNDLVDFEVCPSSATGESVCTAVLDASTGDISASCGVVACAGADCPNTVVNEVVKYEDECLNSGRGSLGLAFVPVGDYETVSCGCSADVVDPVRDFTACSAPANGKATCITTNSDDDRDVPVQCGVVCNEGFVLGPYGTCTKLPIGAPAPINYASTSAHNGGSSSWHYGSSTAAPTTTSYHPHQAHMPAPSMGPSGSYHNAHNPTDSSSSTTTTGAVVPTTTTTMMYGSTTATPGPSQRAARRAADEFVFSADVCVQDERTCPGDDIMCVRLDDVTQCGGCHATGDAVNCLEIPGASSVSCLRGGCIVRSCQTGYFQTAEGRCERL